MPFLHFFNAFKREIVHCSYYISSVLTYWTNISRNWTKHHLLASFLSWKISFSCKILFYNNWFLQIYSSITSQSFPSFVYYIRVNRVKASLVSFVLFKYSSKEKVSFPCHISSALSYCTDSLNYTLLCQYFPYPKLSSSDARFSAMISWKLIYLSNENREIIQVVYIPVHFCSLLNIYHKYCL